MGHDANVKLLRKQIRNVVQELFPSILEEEMLAQVYSRLQSQMLEKLLEINSEIKKTVAGMDERSKDVQTFILNQIQSELGKAHASAEAAKTA